MDDLVAWLRACLDDDERVAREATPGPWDWGIPNPRYWRRTEEGPASEDLLCNESGQWVLMTSKAGAVSAPNARHIARWDPARVLAEVEAKRAVLDLHPNVNEGDCGTCVDGEWGYPTNGAARPSRWPCATVRLLAQPYAARPGFRDEWRLA